ncbi:hypothetical protein TKK_0004989 [Trichogramma kaykai]|uniref:RING-type domain-containing protein n=1 Tax=Trichogramma kaykai TaxID=54128 RepID=A0ABD2XKE0_9HYME
MSSSIITYSVAYSLISFCIVYPPTECEEAGLTIKTLLSGALGSESNEFIQYHIRRSCITLLIHSMLPLLYFVGLFLIPSDDFNEYFSISENFWTLILFTCSLIYTISILVKISNWYNSKWKTHPIVKNLLVYCNDSSTFSSIANDINAEYRRIDKYTIETNKITKVVVTENWIIKISPYNLHFAHQSDTTLVVNKTDTHAPSASTKGEVQFVNIEVTPARPNATKFDIRLNSADFKDLQDRIIRPITVLDNIVFHKTILEKFIDTFKEQIAKNPKVFISQELEHCVMCMQALSNVKLNKLCITQDQTPDSNCIACYCRPMYCVECVAKWFASRQDQNAPETWLSSKCTCPICRAKFCLLDVCYVEKTNNS